MTAVRQAFRQQARACASLGSPLMERLMAGLADRLTPGDPVSDKILAWPGDPSSKADSVPLRLAGGLHALVLSGQDHDLAKAYADPSADPTETALAAIAGHPDFLLDWLTSPPQTNEVRRSAVLISAAHWLTARFGVPLILSELGASAGLNLLWDHYAVAAQGQIFGPADPALTLSPDWTGPPPPFARPTILDRQGVDLNPLDPVTDRLRLLAYLWPDQPDRIARTRAALDLAAGLLPKVDRADAADWLETRLASPTNGALHLIFHTVAWQYFPPATQSRALAAVEAAGKASPLARLSMEADGQSPAQPLPSLFGPAARPSSSAVPIFMAVGSIGPPHCPDAAPLAADIRPKTFHLFPNIPCGARPSLLRVLHAQEARQKDFARNALNWLNVPTRATPARSAPG